MLQSFSRHRPRPIRPVVLRFAGMVIPCSITCLIVMATGVAIPAATTASAQAPSSPAAAGEVIGGGLGSPARPNFGSDRPRGTSSRVPLAPAASQTTNKTTKQSATSGTAVEVPASLHAISNEGGVPASLDQLRALQKQQQKVAAGVKECTLSVQIGPAQGGGVIITPTGFVLTAAHVAMRPGKSAVLTLADGRTVTAKTLGMNRNVDAGLMKIDDGQNKGRPWPHAALGSSARLKPGMWCIATGHPNGYDAERGMVTRVGRILSIRPGSIVTDCALIGGDSGGPLFDLSGRLIAIHSRIGNDVADNLHVPIDHYDESWTRMSAGEAWGFLPGFRPILGVRGNGSAPTAEVLAVSPGSPADKAGLQTGDVVEMFGENSITDFESLKNAVADTMPGERVRIWLRRDGRPLQVTVVIGRADDE